MSVLARAEPVWSTRSLDPGLVGRRGVGLALLVLSVVPVYRVLAAPQTGLAGASTVQMVDAYRDFGLSVLLLSFAAALIVARFWTTVQARLRAAGGALERLPALAFALGCACLAGAGALAFNLVALHGEPNLIDATSQLMQARYLAHGHLAGPASEMSAFWHMQQSVVTENGWVSQYPPGHVALLALGYAIGFVQVVGPVLLAVTVFFSARTAELLYPEQKAVARLGALFIAASPFLIAHAGAFMNHTSAAACVSAAIYCAVRARHQSRALVLMGAALGFLATIRPLSALTVGIVLFAFVLTQERQYGRTILRLLAGALPFALLLGAYNNHFFGSPLRFGYEAALGPAGALGFGVDPWGNTFGLAQAIAYTAAELAALNLQLLETAVPAVLVVALFVLFAPTLQRADRLLLALAVAPLMTHLLYWHHGLFMGPRMLNEYAPVWCLLFARALTVLPSMLRDAQTFAGYTARSLTSATLLTGTVALLALAPMRLASYATPPSPAQLVLAGVSGPALVFVHGGWEDRIGMRLAASGMRLDSVETLIRQNSTCAAQHYADARSTGARLPVVDFEGRATNLPPRREIAPGSLIRAGGEPWPVECRAQAYSDRAGVIDPARLLLHSDLSMSTKGVIIARDLGPGANQALLRLYPGRAAYLLHASADDTVALDSYAPSVALLWGSNAEAHQP